MEEATTRQRWLLAVGLSLALVPSRLVDLSPGLTRTAGAPALEADPMQLVLAAPDLLAPALRLEAGPSFEPRAPRLEPAPRAPRLEPSLPAPLVAVRSVAEPPAWLLLGLSLASAASASRGMRRSPRWHPPR